MASEGAPFEFASAITAVFRVGLASVMPAPNWAALERNHLRFNLNLPSCLGEYLGNRPSLFSLFEGK